MPPAFPFSGPFRQGGHWLSVANPRRWLRCRSHAAGQGRTRRAGIGDDGVERVGGGGPPPAQGKKKALMCSLDQTGLSSPFEAAR